MHLSKIPTTIVTGFLGSGKTTLLRHLLTHAQRKRIAVIVNEFGALGIDGEILRSCPLSCEDDPRSQVYELTNGCICCTVQEEFFPVMQALVARRDTLDHILIETSGLALPTPLVKAFQWPEIKSHCTVDAVITVVDGPAVAAGQFAADPEAVNAQRLRDPALDHTSSLHELFEDQLSAADLILLNKVDAMSAMEREAAINTIRSEVSEQIKIIQASYGRLDPALVLGLECAAEDTIDQRAAQHNHGEDNHDHDAFRSVVVNLAELTGAQVIAALQELIAGMPIYRAKGFIAVPGKPMRLVVQGVGKRFDSYFDRPWRPEETRRSQLVLIGYKLDPKAIEQELQRRLIPICMHTRVSSPSMGGEAKQGRYPVNIDPLKRVARQDNPELQAEQGIRSDEDGDGG